MHAVQAFMGLSKLYSLPDEGLFALYPYVDEANVPLIHCHYREIHDVRS